MPMTTQTPIVSGELLHRSSIVELSLENPAQGQRQHDSPVEAFENADFGTSTSNVAYELRPVTKKRQAWVLVSAFLTICITIGFNQSYGVFQRAYASRNSGIVPPEQAKNSALIAFIGTLGAGLTWAGSIFINPLMERMRNLRYLTASGVVLISLGFGLASIATQAWHLVLAQGLLYGLGSSLLYFPILSVVPEYFDRHRGSAMGFVLSGAGVGAVAFSLAVQSLIDKLGVRWTLRVLCFCNLLISSPIAVTASPSRFLTRRTTHVSLSTAKKPAFILSTVAAILQSSGNLIPLTFLSEFSVQVGYTAAFGATLIAINNGVNSFSRVLTGAAGDFLGRQNILIATVLGCAIAVAGFWLGSITHDSQTLWLMFVVFYGVFSGGYNALFPTTIAEVFGVQAYASVNGFMYFVRGLGSFFGSPVAGTLLGEGQPNGYLKVAYLDTALLFGASACVIGVRYFDSMDKGHFKLKA
jgi:MFS family permease